MSISAATEEELAYVKSHVNVLSNLPVTIPNDHVPSPDALPRKIHAFPIDLPAPPKRAVGATGTETQGSITLIIKSLKPPISFNVGAHPTDTIASIKERLASQESRAPSADVQRLLIKGKVLADNKLLKEYDAAVDGVVINLMVKPGTQWNAEEPKVTAPKPASALEPSPIPSATRTGHSRSPSQGGHADEFPVPSLVLEAPSSPSDNKRPVPLKLDTEATVSSRPPSPWHGVTHNYVAVVTSTGYWKRLREFLGSEFVDKEDADTAFESFLLASKDRLTAGEIAKIRDAVGVVGMAGT